MECKAIRTKGKTVFYTKNETLLTELLIKSGVKNIQYITDVSITTTHLNKRITDDQAIKYRYEVSKLSKAKTRKKDISDLKIITGFKGCLITGNGLMFY